MSDEFMDPSGNTEAFRAFQTSESAGSDRPSRLPLIIVLAVSVVLAAIAVAWLALA